MTSVCLDESRLPRDPWPTRPPADAEASFQSHRQLDAMVAVAGSCRTETPPPKDQGSGPVNGTRCVGAANRRGGQMFGRHARVRLWIVTDFQETAAHNPLTTHRVAYQRTSTGNPLSVTALCVRTVCQMPPETPVKHRDLRGHSDAHRCCVKSLMGTALVRFAVGQHARKESISKRAPSTTRTSLHFRINELRAAVPLARFERRATFAERCRFQQARSSSQ